MTNAALISSAAILLVFGLTWSRKNVLNAIAKIVLFGVGILDVIALVKP